MDIKPVGLGYFPTISPQKPELSVQISNSFFYPLSPSIADEVIDCVEIQSNQYQPAPDQPPPYTTLTVCSVKNKGSLIDVWI
jgi:hypothetical protein